MFDPERIKHIDPDFICQDDYEYVTHMGAYADHTSGGGMIFWSDDCLHCLCGLPHTVEEHTEEMQRAFQALEGERQAWERDHHWDNDAYGHPS